VYPERLQPGYLPVARVSTTAGASTSTATPKIARSIYLNLQEVKNLLSR